jgi:hypothetical protein
MLFINKAQNQKRAKPPGGVPGGAANCRRNTKKALRVGLVLPRRAPYLNV